MNTIFLILCCIFGLLVILGSVLILIFLIRLIIYLFVIFIIPSILVYIFAWLGCDTLTLVVIFLLSSIVMFLPVSIFVKDEDKDVGSLRQTPKVSNNNLGNNHGAQVTDEEFEEAVRKWAKTRRR